MKRFGPFLQLIGVALLIFGAKLWLIETAGSDLPLIDQWDGEGEKVIRPWLEGHLTGNDIISSHNEHRIITTKLYALGLFHAGGQWNALVETTTNAAIHTACALILLLLSRRWMEDRWRWIVVATVTLLFALPFAWENTLYGFQVQFYFLLLFSLGHVVLSLTEERLTWRWSIGQLCGVLAVVTMASGLLSSIAVLGALAMRAMRERKFPIAHIATAAMAAVLGATGWWMKAYVPEHDFLRPRNILQFADSLLQLLAWPGPKFLPLVFLPSAVFLVRFLRGRRILPTDLVLFGLLSWSTLQCVALAYGRGGGTVLSSRYFDLLAINVVLGGVFLITELSGKVRAWGTLIWLVLVGTGLVDESHRQWNAAIQPHTVQRLEQQEHVRNYLRSGKAAEFEGLSWPTLPYPSGRVLLERLSSPAIQGSLPPSVRRPVAITLGASRAPQLVPASLESSQFIPAFSSWSSTAVPITWRSANQPDTTLPILRFRIAGNLGSRGHDVRLVVKSAAGEVSVIPESEPGMRWKTVNVMRPAGEWWIEATDNDASAWFAFTEPVEVSRWTWLAEKMLKLDTPLMILGGLLLLLALSALWGRPTFPGTQTPRPAAIAAAIGVIALSVLWCLRDIGGSRHAITALPTLEASTKEAIGASGWVGKGPAVRSLPRALSRLQARVSNASGDHFAGEHVTGWYRVAGNPTLLVSGYPTRRPNELTVEVRQNNGTISTIKFDGADPGESWLPWTVPLPADAVALRVRAVDATTSWGGWLGFSEPFEPSLAQTIDWGELAQTWLTILVSLGLVLAPGLVWRGTRGGSCFNVIWPGPLLLLVGGAACWALGGIVAPETLAVLWVATTIIGVVVVGWQKRVWATWTEIEKRVLLIFALCVTGAAAKAAFSGGPLGELYAGQISRTLEVGDRPDSRIPYHTVQLIAQHLSPHSKPGTKYFAPWDFSGRGPLAGLAAAPIVLATGAVPPLGMPDQPWSPFDPQGFAAYRIALITLAGMSLFAVVAVVGRFATQHQAWIAAGFLGLTPFFWHELYFTWPKLSSAACVLAGFAAALDRRPLNAAVWLGAGFLFHPLALMSVPFIGLWILFSDIGSTKQRWRHGCVFGGGVIAIIALWHQLNGWHPSQGGFLQYVRAADGVYDVSAAQWWASRWTSIANTVIPFYVLFESAGHPAFNALAGRSNAVVHFFFQYWTALPFTVGLLTGVTLLPALVRGIQRHPRAAALTVIGPALLFGLYWGIATTGLMREGGHTIFLAGWAFLLWSAGDAIPAWSLGLPFTVLRAAEVLGMMFAPSLIGGTWGGVWLLNDLVWLAVSTVCLVAIGWLVSRPLMECAALCVPAE